MVLCVDVRYIPYVLWMGVRDIPYGFMGGLVKIYTLWFYGWV